MELAPNDEAGARACFMAARCEINSFFVGKNSNYNSFGNNIPNIPTCVGPLLSITTEITLPKSMYNLEIEKTNIDRVSK